MFVGQTTKRIPLVLWFMDMDMDMDVGRFARLLSLGIIFSMTEADNAKETTEYC